MCRKNFNINTLCMAERQGFEPWVPFRVHTLSKRAPSTTRPSLHRANYLFEFTIPEAQKKDTLGIVVLRAGFRRAGRALSKCVVILYENAVVCLESPRLYNP